MKHHAISTRDLSRLHQFGKKVVPWIFLGYELIAGGFWKGDIRIADLEDMENWVHQKFVVGDSTRKKP